MATLHLMVGLPCSGKTTRAKKLEREQFALRLTPDEWHIHLFGQDAEEPEHDARHSLIEMMLWNIASRALELGMNVILDFGFWAREEREDYRSRAKELGASSEVHFLDVPTDELMRRLTARNSQSSPSSFSIPEEMMKPSFFAPMVHLCKAGGEAWSGDGAMSDASSASNNLATEGFASWNDYWRAHGAPWRTEPEIDEARQTYLAERRAIQPDIERGIYSFKDIALTRADVEWLLATHESGGMRGPVNWRDEQQQSRVGIDLRGAMLCGVDLQGLPLARVRAGLTRAERAVAPLNQREEASGHLERAQLDRADLRESTLYHAHLEHASLREAHLAGAILEAAHLEDANLYQARLGGIATELNTRVRLWRDQRQRLQLRPADLRRVFMNQGTNLNRVELGDRVRGFAPLADIRWDGVNLAVVDWEAVSRLGDETVARTSRTPSGRRKKKAVRREEYQAAVRANRQLAVVLRNQGLNEAADRYAYRAHVCQRAVLRLRYHYSRYVGSLLLDLLAGYGYRPGRSILVYLAVILWFANFYIWASHGLFSLGLPPTHVAPLAWYEGLILSVSSFHGRGFQPFQNLNDPIAALAGMQAVLGLIIEVSFIATFTQRFFAR